MDSATGTAVAIMSGTAEVRVENLGADDRTDARTDGPTARPKRPGGSRVKAAAKDVKAAGRIGASAAGAGVADRATANIRSSNAPVARKPSRVMAHRLPRAMSIPAMGATRLTGSRARASRVRRNPRMCGPLIRLRPSWSQSRRKPSDRRPTAQERTTPAARPR